MNKRYWVKILLLLAAFLVGVALFLVIRDGFTNETIVFLLLSIIADTQAKDAARKYV